CFPSEILSQRFNNKRGKFVVLYFITIFAADGEEAIYEKLKTTFKHMIVFGVSGVINRALSVLLIPLYTSHIQPREYGALSLLMIIFSAIPIVLRVGLNNALLRSWYDYEESERPKLATTVLVFLLAVSIPILITLAFFAPQISTLFFGN